jgi:hypothetical protein
LNGDDAETRRFLLAAVAVERLGGLHTEADTA